MLTINIITPTNNLSSILYESIESVKLQVSKNYKIKHIIIMDCESNKTDSVHEENYELNYVETDERHGVSFARNSGLKKIISGFVFYLDADDIWPKNYIQSVLNIYNEDENINAISVVGYDFGINVERPRPITPMLKEGFINKYDINYNPIGCPSGFSFRVDNEITKIEFNNELKYLEDYMYYYDIVHLYGKNIYRTYRTNFWYRRSTFQSTRNITVQDKKKFERVLYKIIFNSEKYRRINFAKKIILFNAMNLRFSILTTKSKLKKNLIRILISIIWPKYITSQLKRMLIQGKEYV